MGRILIMWVVVSSALTVLAGGDSAPGRTMNRPGPVFQSCYQGCILQVSNDGAAIDLIREIGCRKGWAVQENWRDRVRARSRACDLRTAERLSRTAEACPRQNCPNDLHPACLNVQTTAVTADRVRECESASTDIQRGWLARKLARIANLIE